MSKRLSNKSNGKRFYRKAPVTVTVQEVKTPSQGKITAVTVKFPSIPRIITERLSGIRSIAIDMWIVVGFLTGVILMGIVISGIRLQQNMAELSRIQGMRDQTLRQVAYWKEIVKTKGNYRDGYYALAALSYQLGDEKNARWYLEKVLTLDPQFKQAKILSEKLGS
jgi:hypothetical protein